MTSPHSIEQLSPKNNLKRKPIKLKTKSHIRSKYVEDFSFEIYVRAAPPEGVPGGGGTDFISPASFILRNIIQG